MPKLRVWKAVDEYHQGLSLPGQVVWFDEYSSMQFVQNVCPHADKVAGLLKICGGRNAKKIVEKIIPETSRQRDAARRGWLHPNDRRNKMKNREARLFIPLSEQFTTACGNVMLFEVRVTYLITERTRQ